MAQDCLFCRMASGELQADILYRDDRSFVLRDIHPVAPVHLLIIPLQHFTYLTEMTEVTEPMVGHLFAVAQEMARQAGVTEEGYRLAINQGANAGQTIPHLHVHLLGGRELGSEG